MRTTVDVDDDVLIVVKERALPRALAVAQGGRLATFDRGLPLSAVPGARAEHLVLL